MKEQSTEQLNLRMPKKLLNDLDLIADFLNVNKSEWIKIKLGELAYQEKSKIIEHYVELNKKGLIDKNQLEKITKKLYEQ